MILSSILSCNSRFLSGNLFDSYKIVNPGVKFPGYGYRRITIELHRRGIEVNHKLVHRLMKEDNLLCIRKQFVPRTTDSEHNLPIYPNLTKGLLLTDINQYWAADITYIRLKQEFMYRD